MQFEVLGTVRITDGGGTTPLCGQVRIGLLSVLLARANTPVPAESLQDSLWGDRPTPVRAQRLQTNVHRLRKILDEPGRLTFDSGNYTFWVPPGELDADQFIELVSRAAHCDEPRQRVALLRSALGLWRGVPFQGVDLSELVAHAQWLTERKQVALEELYAAELECGRHAEVVADLTEQARLHPFRERLQALLMTALYRSGRQAEALAAYRNARETLVDELGLEPGAELRALEQQILAGDESAVAPPSAPPARPPAQLPPRPHDFMGRKDELAELERCRTTGDHSVPVVVSGTAGAGKSALVTHWAHGAREAFPDGQLHVDLQGFSPHDPLPATVALGRFLRALGEDNAAVPDDLVERAARFRTLTEGRRLLVVLDNAASSVQVRPLLPGASTCFVVITSRDTLSGLTAGHGAYRLDVGRMSQDEARSLLHARAKHADFSQESAARLIEHCARLPVVLQVAAERLRESYGHDIARLAADLDAEHDELDLFETGDDPTSIRAVLSWSYRQLTPESARLFRMCGYRCEHAYHFLDVAGAAALLGSSDVRTARRLLGELARCGLMERQPDGRFQMHQLLQSYAAEMADHHERSETPRRLTNYYLHGAATAAEFIQPREVALRAAPLLDSCPPGVTGCASAMRWLDANRPNLLCLAELLAEIGNHEAAVDLSTTLWPYLDLGDHRDVARRVHTLARAAARELGDRTAEGIAVRALGVLELRLEHYDIAEWHLREALALHATDAHASRATTRMYLASVFSATGRAEHAVSMAQQAFDASSELDDQAVPAAALNTLARFFRQCGKHQEALCYLRPAHDTAERHDHRLVQAHVLVSLAQVYLDLGHYGGAAQCAHQASDLATDNDVSDLADAVFALRESIPADHDAQAMGAEQLG